MATQAEIWKTLSAIDVSAKTEKKQNMTYLSWAWAWGVMMEHYPQATYEFQENSIEPDGTVSVNVTMEIDGHKRSMWLPVMANGNKAAVKPDAFLINKNKMRCLVKCMAMFGLGHYIYAGEDLPDAVDPEAEYKALCNAHKESIAAISSSLDNYEKALQENDNESAVSFLSLAAEAWYELNEETQIGLWKAHSKGGCFTTAQQKLIKSTEFRQAHNWSTQ